MSKDVLLSAKTGVRYSGKKQSLGQQFYASAADAERLVSTDQADRVLTAAQTKAEAEAEAKAGDKPKPATP